MTVQKSTWLCLLILALFTTALGAEELDEQPSVQVTASGTVTSTPDRVKVSLSVESSARTARAAAETNAKSMAEVIRRVKRADLSGINIRTSGFRLSPRYNDEGKRRLEPVGYMATNTIQIVLDDVDKAGLALDTAMKAGANRVTGLTFELREPEAAYLKALGEAMKSARRQAEVLAEAAGVTLGPALRLSTSGGFRPPKYARAEAFASAARTPIEAGDVTTSATVTATYALGQN
jgi:uncharacterized protein YggE